MNNIDNIRKVKKLLDEGIVDPTFDNNRPLRYAMTEGMTELEMLLISDKRVFDSIDMNVITAIENYYADIITDLKIMGNILGDDIKKLKKERNGIIGKLNAVRRLKAVNKK